MKWHRGDGIYFREVFPVHLMAVFLIDAYLAYLNYALFRGLSGDYRIVLDPNGPEIHGEGMVRQLKWDDIRQIRFGDLYLKIDTFEQ